MNSNIMKRCASVCLLTLAAVAAGQANAQVVVAPVVAVPPVTVGVQVMYDAAGIPIWGYGTRGRAIYAYSPEGLPVYTFANVYSGCYVPTWDFLGTYHGPRWPRGIHRRVHGHPHIRPGRPGPGGPAHMGHPGGPGRPGGPAHMGHPGGPGHSGGGPGGPRR